MGRCWGQAWVGSAAGKGAGGGVGGVGVRTGPDQRWDRLERGGAGSGKGREEGGAEAGVDKEGRSSSHLS